MNEIIVTNPNSIREIIREEISEQLVKFSKWFESKIVEEDRYFTKKEAAKYLSISETTLYRYTRDGYLISHCLGEKVYYKLSEIKSAIKAIN